MSRINDALRRANLERERTGAPQVPGPATAGGADLAARSLAEAKAAVHPNGNEASRAAVLLNLFRERCAPTEWAPRPAAAQFLRRGSAGPGSEELRTLRSRLDLVREGKPLRKLLITSAIPGEGKSFVAANLALVMAWRTESNVLLIDGDLRSPQLHRSLGAPAEPGLCDYLMGNADEFAIVKRGPVENLFFIPGGSEPGSAGELIANGRLKGLLQRLAVAFDWILIDTPPVVPVADAKLIGELCDGVLMVVQAGLAPAEVAQRALLEFKSRPFVGVVLNRAEPLPWYGYKYYYGNGKPRLNGKK